MRIAARIIVCGDMHGDYQKLKNLTADLRSEDYCIVTGDFGFIFYKSRVEENTRFLNQLPFTLLFVDGNHENFDLLREFPLVERYQGRVHQVADRVYHLMRGEIYQIQGKSFFCFGGAKSVDRIYRTRGIDWWEAELPIASEYENGLKNLEKIQYKVDYILTHTVPYEMLYFLALHYQIGIKYHGDRAVTALSRYAEKLQYQKWFFGHFHIDVKYKRFIGLFQERYEIKRRNSETSLHMSICSDL